MCDTSLMEEHHGKWYACGRRCGAVLTSMRAAPAHQREAHRYWDRATGWHLQPLRFVPKSPRWIWELLGFADLWDGRPRGWYEVLDGAEVRDRAYEADALVLGDRVACYLRLEVAS